MPDLSNRPLVTADWLGANLQSPDLMIFDGSWHLPTENRDARAEYAKGHIPGAFYFDIDDLSDDENPLPHMLPSPVKFASRLKRIGVGDGLAVVAEEGFEKWPPRFGGGFDFDDAGEGVGFLAAGFQGVEQR